MRLDSLTDSEIFRAARPAVAYAEFWPRARRRSAARGPAERRAPVSLLCACSLCKSGAALEVRVSRQDGVFPSVAGDWLIACPCLPAMPGAHPPQRHRRHPGRTTPQHAGASGPSQLTVGPSQLSGENRPGRRIFSFPNSCTAVC